MPGPNVSVRPGYYIRDVLTGLVPINGTVNPMTNRIEGDIVDEASATQMYRAYKLAISKLRRMQRSRVQRALMQRGMSYQSFLVYVRAARKLGLIGETGRGDVRYPGGDQPFNSADEDTLLTIQGKGDSASVVPSTPIYYQLTTRGKRATDRIWNDLQEALSRTTR